MKTLQLMTYMVGRLMKKEKIFYDEDETNIYFTDSYTIYKTPKNNNFIDLNKIKKANTSYLIKKYDPVKAIKVENINIHDTNNPWGTLCEATCKDEKFYFYKERLKYFSKNYELYKVSTDPYAPIYVLEKGELQGCFLAVRMMK